jgi:hypothetical protein
MKTIPLALAGVLLASAAVAQTPPGPGPDSLREAAPPPHARGPGAAHPMGPPPRAAHFRFERGPARIDIHCAADEPTKACVDAASALLDKIVSLRGDRLRPDGARERWRGEDRQGTGRGEGRERSRGGGEERGSDPDDEQEF